MGNEILPQLVYSLSDQNVRIRFHHHKSTQIFAFAVILQELIRILLNYHNVIVTIALIYSYYPPTAEILQEGRSVCFESCSQALSSARTGRYCAIESMRFSFNILFTSVSYPLFFFFPLSHSLCHSPSLSLSFRLWWTVMLWKPWFLVWRNSIPL